jgi:serine/threonine protein phosphatase PrpC
MRSRPKKKRTSQKRRRIKSTTTKKGDKTSCWARTDLGLKRELNEDSYLADSNISLFIVADGMGGHAGGNIASKMSVDIIRQRVREARKAGVLFSKDAIDNESPAVLKMLEESIKEASARIFEKSDRQPELAGMGTTVTLMLTHGKRAYVAHVGDSRLYRLRNGKFEQMTEDHSLVNEQVKAGFITSEEAQHSRFRNIITRSVGFESEVNADTMSLVMNPADIFLICSDGLTGMIEDDEIHKTIRKTRLSQAPSRLVDLANRAGGEDNVTVVVLKYGDGQHDKRVSKSRKKRQNTRKTARKRAKGSAKRKK